MEKSKTAILLFSRSAKEEARVKALARSAVASKAVASFNIKSSAKVAEMSMLPVFAISERLQKGTTFGERFANAFEFVFDLGFEKVIAIGNDCLTLTTSDLLRAAEELNCHDCVIGPAKDGGMYLIGLHKHTFVKEIFEQCMWQTEYAMQVFIDSLPVFNCDVKLLSVKADVDSLNDWALVWHELSSDIIKRLTQLFNIGKSWPLAYYTISVFVKFFRFPDQLRAPPLLHS